MKHSTYGIHGAKHGDAGCQESRISAVVSSEELLELNMCLIRLCALPTSAGGQVYLPCLPQSETSLVSGL